MLKVNGLKVSFGELEVLKNVCFDVSKGEVLGVLGKNGAGKTTLFNSISLFNTFKGTITLNDLLVKPANVAYVETENFFYPYMYINEYIRLHTGEKSSDNEKLSSYFNLPNDRFLHDYSTGMKKKAAIVANVSLEREILVLDEPFNGLDFESVQKLYLLIDRIKQSKIVLISSHIFETLKNTCDKIIYLQDGVIKNSFIKQDFDQLENLLKNEFSDHKNDLDLIFNN